MRCNIFKPISNETGEFLLFSQYTDDLTKEDPAKGSYRVTPSRFAALELNLTGFISYICAQEGISESDAKADVNKWLSQYLQSYYENSVCLAKEVLGYDKNNKELYWDEDSNDDGYATQLLWKSLETWGLIHTETISGHNTIPELKFVGEINIHSDRQVDGMNYNDIYCYISPSDDEKYYGLSDISGFDGEDGTYTSIPLVGEDYDYSDVIMGWTQAAYPVNNGGIDAVPRSDSGSYNISGKYPIMNLSSQAFDRHDSQDPNTSFIFNCVIVFYDVYNDLDLEETSMLHYNRPAGIYFTGPAYMIDEEDLPNTDSNGDQLFLNQVTKYVSHEDIFGQGTGWSVRLMTRVVSTPNASSYAMVVDGGDDYETIAGAMGQIATAIADIRTDMRLQSENYQLMKDHLAIFKNYRTNVPYTRKVSVPGEGAVDFWFVNGRNTEQRVYPPES